MLVEGPTERAVVENVFNPELCLKGVYLYPRVVGKPGHKGGNRFSSVSRELKALIRQEPTSYVTMLFDYYGLPGDWPGLQDANKREADDVPAIMEPAITKALQAQLGRSFNPRKFIPYIQLHEIESLLFAGPHEMADVFENPGLVPKIKAIIGSCGGCEQINNNPETAPSKRIQQLFPEYKKGSGVNAHAYRIAKRIGLETIRLNCPNFNRWITRLESLSSND